MAGNNRRSSREVIQLADVPVGGQVIDEQARLHACQLDATTEIWMPCTSVYFIERITIRGSPSMQELVVGRGPDDAGLTIFYDPRRDTFMIRDAKAIAARDRVIRCRGTNVKTYTLAVDEDPALGPHDAAS